MWIGRSYHTVKKFTSKIARCNLTGLQIEDCSGRNQNVRRVLKFSVCVHACTHTESVNLLFIILWKLKTIENLR
jgi:hypothetical protein